MDANVVDSIFHLDLSEDLLHTSGSLVLSSSAHHNEPGPSSGIGSRARSSSITHEIPFTPLGDAYSNEMDTLTSASSKGKQVSKPMLIRIQTTETNYDTFASFGLRNEYPSTSVLSPTDLGSQTFGGDLQNERPSVGPGSSLDGLQDVIEPLKGKGKGKAREEPPCLPPLTFSPTEFGYPGEGCYLTKTEPSLSPSSRSLPSRETTSPVVNTQPVRSSEVMADSILRRMPTRRRSFSNFSIRSRRSVSINTLSKFKTVARFPGNLSRLIQRKQQCVPESGEPTYHQSSTTPTLADLDHGPCIKELFPDDTQNRAFNIISPSTGISPTKLDSFRPAHKGRAYTSPILTTSAIDFIPALSTDILIPIPVRIHNHFDILLPPELKLQVLRAVVTLHETEQNRMEREGHWTAMKAARSRNKWVGREKGVRELIKFSRVSKSWQRLVFDGQLWEALNLRPFPEMSSSLVVQLSKATGPFAKALDVNGHSHLVPSTLIYMTDHFCTRPALVGNLPHTQLTSVNLQGCLNLSTRALHHLLIRSPSLEKLILKGLSTVTNTTCDVLAVYCPLLVSLDLSRCSAVDGDGIRSLAKAALTRGEYLRLKELRLAGMRNIYDSTMSALGKAAPFLEILDLSYVRQLHNSALEAFVACDTDFSSTATNAHTPIQETVLLSARQVGRDEFARYRRRLTRLRHLSVSGCVLLTDIGASNLAHSVPKLEFLEMGGIGTELRDEGLVRLLETMPMVRRVDLEDASEITDRVVQALTPSSPVDVSNTDSTKNARVPEPGHYLEHLIISYAGNVTNQALLNLVRNCTRLTVLEADNTLLSSTVLKEFVKHSQERKHLNSRIVAVDCRGIGEGVVKDLSSFTRPRLGFRSYEGRKLKFVDGRDEEEGVLGKVGQDECDETKVVLKTFYSWQTVDAVGVVREKRKKAISRRNGAGSISELEDVSSSGSAGVLSRRGRWWSPGSGRSAGTGGVLTLGDVTHDRDGCVIM